MFVRTYNWKITSTVVLCALAAMCALPLSAKTTIESSTGTATFDFTSMADKFQSKIDLFGPNMADSVSLAANLGYPIGKSTLGNFPGFEIGFAAGGGMTGMDYFDSKNSDAKANGVFPGVSPAIGLHAGIGLGGGFDVIGKFSYVSLGMYKGIPKPKLFQIEKAYITSMGGRVRYQLVKEHTVIPFLFSFGGISLSGGADYLYGLIRASGTYKAKLPEVSFSIPLDPGSPYSLQSQFDGSYSGRLEWNDITATAQITAYFDFFYIFSFYTGLSVTGGVGYYNINFNGTGSVTVIDDGTPAYSGFYTANGNSAKVGDIIFTSKTGFTPIPFQPLLICGLEINLGPIKLNGETAVSLADKRDINALVGARFQF